MADTKNLSNQLETTLEEYFGKKAPQLPANIREIIVKVSPYLAILSILITVPALLLLFGLGGVATMVAPVGGMESVASLPTMWISIIMLIPAAILNALSIKGLMARKIDGWRYAFWAQLVGVFSQLISFNIFGAVISALIGFYILFQVKSYYK